jgi:hypothetical protein
VQAGGYQQKEGDPQQKPCVYRFQKPLDEEFPQMLELFSRVPDGRNNKHGMPSWVGEDRLIPLKAAAWMEMSARARAGEAIDSKKINKHLSDVVQLSVLLKPDQRIEMPEKLRANLQAFAKAVVELNSPDQLLATRRIAEAYGFKL